MLSANFTSSDSSEEAEVHHVWLALNSPSLRQLSTSVITLKALEVLPVYDVETLGQALAAYFFEFAKVASHR